MGKNFQTRILTMMSILKVSQQDIAEKTGISKSLICRYCNGELNPKVSKVNSIAQAYGIDPLWFMGYDVSMFSEKEIIENGMPYYLGLLKQFTENLTEKEREKAYNILKAAFPDK